ncbi:hypothetical protein CBR_g88565 [Chara braunii]|uniref:SGTA homodimerisation domain-containing protein n=1 Tax=Chara braunii TaxID=69332 RepID=A0A388KB98_CHABU|nr:hypothetical protein CBR_g88565 [Chara braunii]|eukprot:GBG67276.1 hypothetical protein CBR_g88565 [Chara braunii]
MGGSVAAEDPGCRRVVFAFLEFLDTVQLPSGADDEGLEVVKECLSDVFGVRIDDEKQQRELSIRPKSLLELVSSVSVTSKHPPPKVEVTATCTSTRSMPASMSPPPSAEGSVFQQSSAACAGDSLNETVRVNGGATPSGTTGVEEHAKFGEFLSGLEAGGYFAGTEPGSEEYLGRLEKAKKLLEESIKAEEETKRVQKEDARRQPEDAKALAEELKAKGNAAVSAKQYQQAVELYTRAISLVDTSAIYYANRAVAHTHLHDYSAAIRDCKRAIELDPKYAKAYGRLGTAYFELGKYRDAVEWYQKALELDPLNSSCRDNLQMAQQQFMAEQNQSRSPHQSPPHQEQPRHPGRGGAPQQSQRPGPAPGPSAAPGPQYPPNAPPNMPNACPGGMPGMGGIPGMPQGLPAGIAGMIPDLLNMASQIGIDVVDNRFGRNPGDVTSEDAQDGGADTAGNEQRFNLNIDGPQLEQMMQMFMNSAGRGRGMGRGGAGRGEGGGSSRPGSA